MNYIYLLKSKKQDWLYTGYTSDLKKRFQKHQGGHSSATKPYCPFELVFYEAYKSRLDAKRRKKYLKTNQGKRALKLMLRDSFK
ncbi:hypothetical protein A3I27_03435 [Candidatus Giovannonibacteria bacterium RIFCSPLOWO2_02_FULL_43_11b]|uniref:GIY-YIG domain-containing protein n=1 Tax=Candidatus Giovannonibacteria bacterium RIFCSPHIGHO2_12_FULL_43_15 TaxID=1798341 RepID=A0A1F5WQV3_9BACT|nr:MAG: hypothetical protein A2739_02800 [Candidatus Giovannonibacteria bacterium RIFCSPHIGHO2_01_FULL_43_100]OGF67169.1 MAG: hypothetical protein A3B97_01695 [Candidatus Giovannonibacteria bacterium RIFCSPHIGHO2_02_FULL_43_32]OGF78052.1 MAG: hypothetical protein A3F23_02155 [Candidatus Giovannonibacteria bacterium RIFCSPHIGHO2_12_FULL_43_15]OGF78401.1 MAG: hypothetical protein A3A15_02440 [Candidatus Giovannonibacteria bacterium RIFCSPLOWO2_01_FULL_43_60]OGF89044.1 MAG: hypothetical protein A3